MVFEGPGIVARIKAELVQIMEAEGVAAISDLAA
jgi:dihydroorotate dehydrogenase